MVPSAAILCRPFSADTRDATPAKLPGVIVVHENRGLNPHTEDVARRFALENFMAFAPDALTSVSGYPGDDYKGGLLFSKLDGAKRGPRFPGRGALAEGASPTAQAKSAPPESAIGGGVANTLAVQMGDDLGAAAPFYGAPTDPEVCPRSRRRSSSIMVDWIRPLAGGYPAQAAELEKNHIRF